MKKIIVSKFCRIAFAMVLLCGMLLCTSCGSNGGKNAAEARNGIVLLAVLDENGNFVQTGSAFGVGDAGKPTDTFVTNHHVVNINVYDDDGNVIGTKPATAIYIILNDSSFNYAVGLDISQCIYAEVIYEAPTGYPDMAVIKAAEVIEERVALPLLDDMDDLESGDDIYALGYPGKSNVMQNDKLIGSVESATVTKGVVSRIFTASAIEHTRLIQHDAQINGGNSGGPLINSDGVVVGINTYTLTMTIEELVGGESTSSLSVTIDQMTRVLDTLDIDYDTDAGIPWVAIIIISVSLLVIGAAVAVTLLLLKKKQTPAPPPAPVAPAPMPVNTSPRLQCLSGTFQGKRYFIEGAVRIGRDPSKNDLVFPAQSEGISGVHCVVRLGNGCVMLQDLGSTYGTFLGDGRRLAAGETANLKIGDRFWLGSENECFVITPKGGL